MALINEKMPVEPPETAKPTQLPVDFDRETASQQELDLVDEGLRPFEELLHEHARNVGLPGRHDHTQAMEIAWAHPGIVVSYLEVIKEDGRYLHNVLDLVDKAPVHAVALKSIFDEVPELLPVYASDTPYNPGNEGQVGRTRILAASNPILVEQELNKIKQIEQRLEELLDGQDLVQIASFNDDEVLVQLERMVASRNSDGSVRTEGVLVAIRPNIEKVRQARKTGESVLDFQAVIRKVMANGLVDSRQEITEHQHLGYLFRQEYDLNEPAFFDAIERYEPNSPELNQAVEVLLLDYLLE